MSHDQCPSTVKGEKAKPSAAQLAATPRALQRINGKAAWRSFEEVVDSAEFRENLEREFPRGMAELVTRERMDLGDPTVATGKSGESRREFMKLMGASMALAGVAATIPGCRRPDHKIYTYSQKVPEDIVPGKPLYYVTSMPRFDGGAEGLMVECHEGRPTKIEGNPLHPYNQGKVSSWAQSSIMALYDPDRLWNPSLLQGDARADRTWDDFRLWASTHFAAYDAKQGEGLAFIVEKNSSPSRALVRDRLMKKWPKATWVAYTAGDTAQNELLGTAIAFGSPQRAMLNITKATRIVVSLDRDFLSHEAGELAHARQFAAARLLTTVDDEMTRLYAVESNLTATGGQADHRLPLSAGRVGAFAVALARAVLPKLAEPDAKVLENALSSMNVSGEDMAANHGEAFLEELAKDLLDSANRDKSLIVAGHTQAPAVHAIVAALNQALGNVGKAVSYLPVDAETASDSLGNLAKLAKSMNDGAITTLVCINTNPAFDAPGDVNFVEGWKKVPATITLTVGKSETAAASTWAMNASHYLESWGDTRALDGTVAPIQPMIAPLYEPSMSEIEFLALLGGKDMNAKVDGYEIVREAWRGSAATLFGEATDFETNWRRSLHDGVVKNSASKSTTPKVKFDAIATALGAMKIPAAPTKDSLEVAFTLGTIADGRLANVGWLQELPQYGTRVVWDNPLIMSPKTAAALDVLPDGWTDRDPNTIYTKNKYPHGRMVEIALNGKTLKAVVWICPGVADNTVIATVGYGRTNVGLVGDGVGFNVYPLRSSGGNAFAGSGAKITKTGDDHMVVSTQIHWSMEGRTGIVRAVDLPAWKKHGKDTQKMIDDFYGTQWELNFAERLGELDHTPPNISSYEHPYNRSKADPDPNNKKPGDPNKGKYQQNQPPAFSERPQWGMTIDQTTCTGCGACTIACQAENNIPVVGKKETAKGREMQWIRVDRYFTGDDFNNPSAIHHQPVACVHCENAPCEVVCPVNATVHGPEGLNYMTYNRCIGTRYCANNCPYKVRRYNWFDYGVTKFNGNYFGKEIVEPIGELVPGQNGVNGSTVHNSINPNLIPPRLRQKLDEISRMQQNPDVTVRSRGVMEKCSYCVQRINAAKIDCKLADIRDKDGNYVVPDGFFQAACQQACPSNAIIFGDILDATSKVHASRAHARSYALLGYLNTRPRTSHMVRVMNPNEKLLARIDPERLKHIASPFHGVPGAPHSEGDGHGHEHGEDGKHSFFDKSKRYEDSGYALSLRVLGGGRA